MIGKLDDVIMYLYRDRDRYSKDFNGEMVRLLSGYINTLKQIRKELVTNGTDKTEDDPNS